MSLIKKIQILNNPPYGAYFFGLRKLCAFSVLGVWVLGVGSWVFGGWFWVLVIGCLVWWPWVLGVGCLVVGYWVLGFEFWVLGPQILGVGCWLWCV